MKLIDLKGGILTAQDYGQWIGIRAISQILSLIKSQTALPFE